MPDGAVHVGEPIVETADFVTVLTSVDDPPRRMTKRLHRQDDGTIGIEDYDEGATWFSVKTFPVSALADLATVLPQLDQFSTPVWGEFIGSDPNRTRRLTRVQKDGTQPTIGDYAHHLLPLDLEEFDAVDADGQFDFCADPERAVRFAISKLPPEFEGADCLWQLTSGAGIKQGVRLRLWFWLSEPRTAAQVLRWLKPHLLLSKNRKDWKPDPKRFIDGSIFSRVNQPIYASPPVLDSDVEDPAPRRLGLFEDIGLPVIAPPIATEQDADSNEPEGGDSGYVGIEGPDDVRYDSPETIEWAIELLRKDLGEKGFPKVGKFSDERAFRLIGKLRDGPKWGESLTRNMIAKLLHDHWAPHFGRDWLTKKAANGAYGNGPGVGQAGSDERRNGERYGKPEDWAEYREKANGTGEKTEAEDEDEFRIFNTWEFKDRPQPQWQIENLIRDKAITILFGQSESFKTFLLIDMLASGATGLPAFQHFAVHRPGDTVLCLAEDPDDAMRGRFPAWTKSRGIDYPFGNPLRLPDGTESPGRFVIIGNVPHVANKEHTPTLIARIKRARLNPVHIAIDTCAKAMGGLSQNDAENVGLMVAAMTQLRREFNCSVTGAHHPNKADPKDMRGSGAWMNDVDNVIHAAAAKGSMVAMLEFHKLKGGVKPPAIALRGEIYDVGLVDANGKNQTYPAFRYSHDLEKKKHDDDDAADPINAIRRQIIAYLLRTTKTEKDTVDTGTVALNLWPPQEDEDPEAYQKRQNATRDGRRAAPAN
jgi:RecA-family ATPase